jgi:cytidyltransferase-like protein
MKIAVMIGTFQPWTWGHQQTLLEALSKCDQVYVIVEQGTAPRAPDRPWLYTEIVDMVYSSNFAAGDKVHVRGGAESKDPDVWMGRIVAQVPAGSQEATNVITPYLCMPGLSEVRFPDTWMDPIEAWDDAESAVRDLYFGNRLRFPDTMSDHVPTGTLARLQDWHDSVSYNDIRVQRLSHA